ncbi:NADH:flavin oxidoreductase/NADH oxidase [Halobium salinum]|uniref:NADH:flavin oxidoreductase/NADH oxidase n=1 Tax=Halobium salinum TaxID=1364940 RepID=A0ABD5PCN8_9EURY|nr:NADH:flavin oxidoreductase/NADH oxidase [Halobium salinum]
MTDDLFSTLQLRDLEVPNRVMLSPMCQYSCEDRDGMATEWHRVHLGSRAVGGAGIVMTEATAVEARGRITPEDLGIWSDEHGEALAPVAEFVSEQGGVPAIQLAHAGRKASKTRPWDGSVPVAREDGGWETVAPSAEPWPYDEDDGEAPATRRMDNDDVADVRQSFVAAAERARDAGFRVAEVHAAHGYLLHEFLSPVTNDRDDEYGGSFENRTRLVREIVSDVREVWPDGDPVFVRISATDWLDDEESWDVEQSVRLAEELDDLGVDLLDVSAGGIRPDSAPEQAGPGYQVPLAETITREADVEMKVGAVGGIETAEQADALVRNGRADLAILGRKHLRDPYFTLNAAKKLGREDAVEPPVQYARGFPEL